MKQGQEEQWKKLAVIKEIERQNEAGREAVEWWTNKEKRIAEFWKGFEWRGIPMANALRKHDYGRRIEDELKIRELEARIARLERTSRNHKREMNKKLQPYMDRIAELQKERNMLFDDAKYWQARSFIEQGRVVTVGSHHKNKETKVYYLSKAYKGKTMHIPTRVIERLIADGVYTLEEKKKAA